METLAGFILAAFLMGSPSGWVDLGYVPRHNEPIIPQINMVEKYKLDMGMRFDRGRYYIQMSQVYRIGGQWPEQTEEVYKVVGAKTTMERYYEFGVDLGNNWTFYSEHKDPTVGATWNIATDYYWRVHLRKEF